MSVYSLSHLSDHDLLRGLASHVAGERSETAMALAHIVEVDARRLYVPAGFPSMFLYCVHELHFSEEAARKRIHAARTARQFPAIFPALADGRLHFTAVVLLAPRLTEALAEHIGLDPIFDGDCLGMKHVVLMRWRFRARGTALGA